MALEWIAHTLEEIHTNEEKPALLTLSVRAQAQHGTPDEASVSGAVTDCWEGRSKPVQDLRVYFLTLASGEAATRIGEERIWFAFFADIYK